ncbi:TPA: ABC transporter ATP-binding protein [Citrobacter farmeri]|uniref:ABC transporter ATP-binding protein n=2 Tax=Citrobacter farmeri TaxID=67824 RepID=A0ACA8DAX1_9ENTR|nr:ABC transporter ATP-binding protein [Citrobacter farmeri]HAT2167495.1 ABC transporter ATP-binding protein [Citrobacter freundii]AST81353.1 ABC transporter ATP-binding protein [Citrobacter farmeri]EMB4691678.1 ABC transporter ATP-binding protein [Citrobacter farmeri]MCP1691967.1 peptide/nickel transport system ATP-binding protein [Citrobacter farmeri]MCW2421765.1 peptide/nickel transport system ATP-binding protein [Citrobacter farmeri]
MADSLLEVKDLEVHFATRQGVVSPVRGVSFRVNTHETLGIIGESGCGKSVTAQALMGLLSPRTSRVSGEVKLAGKALHSLSAKARRQRNGHEMAMIFQDPLASLNPVMTIGLQIDESLRLHTSLNRSQRQQKIISLLTQVGIVDPARSAGAWPHELSGGMRQRVMIAMAIATSPSLLIADEPTTALDATIQAQILDLLEEINQQSGMGIVIITHDLSVVARLCQRVVVLYAGQVVEEADVHTLFERPRHPYTRALLAARPSADHTPKTPLAEIRGQVPALHDLPLGCTYADRCPLAQPRCRAQAPELRAVGYKAQQVRCWRADEAGVLR